MTAETCDKRQIQAELAQQQDLGELRLLRSSPSECLTSACPTKTRYHRFPKLCWQRTSLPNRLRPRCPGRKGTPSRPKWTPDRRQHLGRSAINHELSRTKLKMEVVGSACGWWVVCCLSAVPCGFCVLSVVCCVVSVVKHPKKTNMDKITG